MILWTSFHGLLKTPNRAKESDMAAKKGSCGGTPRVGKKGDPKPARGGRGGGRGRRK